MKENLNLQKYALFKDKEIQAEILGKALNIIEDGIHIVDRKGITVFYSAALEKIENNKAADVVGKHICDAYKLDEESSILLKVLKAKKPIINHSTTYYSKKGTEINILTNTYPLFNEAEIIGAVSVNSNFTGKKQLVDTLINLQRQLYSHVDKNGTRYTFEDMIGESSTLKSAVQLAQRIAVNMSPVMIYGETGTGKELFVHSIHNHSLRSKGPLVVVNCAAIPETLLESVLFGTVKGAFTGAEDKTGLFEEADQGTLFLDEISSMNISLQSKLLRVLEAKTVRRLGGKSDIRVNPRIISAINSDPQEAIKRNQLRQDLYYRLAVVTLNVPPLRDRMSDLPLLMGAFIKTANKIMNKKVQESSSQVLALFNRHNWPGNVRELQHAVEHAMNYAEDNTLSLELRHIPHHLLQKYNPDGSDDLEMFLHQLHELPSHERPFHALPSHDQRSLKDLLQLVETEIIRKALAKNDQSITRAARMLGMSRQNLQQRLKRLALRD